MREMTQLRLVTQLARCAGDVAARHQVPPELARAMQPDSWAG